MATNDLMVELQKDSIKLDDDSERKVRGQTSKLRSSLVISHSRHSTVPCAFLFAVRR